MARRRIGQERLGVGMNTARRSRLIGRDVDPDRLGGDRPALGWHLRGGEGRACLATVGAVQALLLATWHDLSDVKLADAIEDRASFRRFCGFSAFEPTPERTAFVRFRAELVRRGLDRALFEAITRQLDAKGVAVRTGTLVDATLIASASIRHDDEARWAGHRRRKPVHGYKAHVATDEDAGLIRGGRDHHRERA